MVRLIVIALLAELCAFISTLAQQPIDQQIAVTGAVDQWSGSTDWWRKPENRRL